MARPKNSTMKTMILNKAEELIASKGVNGFSIGDIANELSISKGTLTYHYKNKDLILLELMEKHFNSLMDEYSSWLLRHKDDLTLDRFLEVIFYKGVKLFNKAKIHIFLINECIGSSILRERYNELWKKWQGEIKKGVRQVIPDCKDPDCIAYLIMLITDGLSVREVLEGDEDMEKRLIKLAKGVFINE